MFKYRVDSGSQSTFTSRSGGLGLSAPRDCLPHGTELVQQALNFLTSPTLSLRYEGHRPCFTVGWTQTPSRPLHMCWVTPLSLRAPFPHLKKGTSLQYQCQSPWEGVLGRGWGQRSRETPFSLTDLKLIILFLKKIDQ